MNEVKEICARVPEMIEDEIKALEAEVNSDMAAGKASHKANLIRLDIARLRLDVHTLAMGIAEIMERQDRQWATLELLLQIRSLEMAAL